MAAQSRRLRIRPAIAVALAAGGVLSATSCGSPQSGNHQAAAYCAIMSDSVGLYADNPVTQMGYQVGRVKNITPGINNVRVDFTVTTPRPLSRDVKAITRSTSILADRSLELVGNYASGPQLSPGECIPLSRTATPKSLSEVIGSGTDFINAINSERSRNIADVLGGLDKSTHNNGAGINRLLTTSSAVLDSPDQAVSDLGSIIRNSDQLTSMVRELRGPLKEIVVDADKTTDDVMELASGTKKIVAEAITLIPLASDLEVYLGEETQFALDGTAVALRKLSAHAPRIANLLNVGPPWINTLANYFNGRAAEHVIRYRPPLYRVHAPDGVGLCNAMNAAMPGSCANVQGEPYAVDIALLQYVLGQARR